MSKKKIAIFINSLVAGGAERTVTHLLNNLSESYEVHLLLLENKIQYDLPKDQIIYILDKVGLFSTDAVNILKIPLIARKFSNYCEQHNISLVLSLLSRPNFIACYAKKRGFLGKLLISERVYTPLLYRKSEIRGRVGNFLVSRLYPFADAILPNSEGTKNALQDYYGIRSNYRVVKNLVSTTEVNRLKIEEVTDITFDSFTFVCVAGFRKQKNHRMLIDAFAEMQDKTVRMLLIGIGPTLDNAKEQVASLNLENRVLFLGLQSNPFKYISRADCFVLASDFEGFPNVLLEALACGMPVVSTDCLTGPRELVSPAGCDKAVEVEFGEYGVLVPVGNRNAMTAAMKEMAANSGLRERYRRVSAARAAEYDQDIIIQEFRSIIDEYLSLDK